jgi:hypothetical protein
MATKKTTTETENPNALAVREQAAIALFEEDAGQGFEDTSAQDFAIPFIALLQGLSPQVDRRKGEYVEGAEPGLFMDTATKELIETFDFIACHYHRADVEWKPRNSGGGFIGQHPAGYAESKKFPKNERGRFITGEGNEIMDTRYFFGLRLRGDRPPKPCVVSMQSTQLKAARSWMTQMADLVFPPGHPNAGKLLPIFAAIWRFTSTLQSNNEGEWSGYRVEFVSLIEDPALAAAAREARKMFADQATNVRPPEDRPSGEGDGGKDVPF